MRILIWGASGRMGSEVARLCREGYRGATAVGGFDVAPAALDFPVWSDPAAITAEADCIVDFSHHAGTVAMLAFAVSHKIPAVIATTGHTEEELLAIREAAKEIPVFHSANMSLGIALLVEFSDVKLSYSKEDFWNLLNQENYGNPAELVICLYRLDNLF